MPWFFDTSAHCWRIVGCTQKYDTWVKVFKNGPSKICVKKLKWYGHFKNFLKAVFHKFYLVHSWIPGPTWSFEVCLKFTRKTTSVSNRPYSDDFENFPNFCGVLIVDTVHILPVLSRLLSSPILFLPFTTSRKLWCNILRPQEDARK